MFIEQTESSNKILLLKDKIDLLNECKMDYAPEIAQAVYAKEKELTKKYKELTK